MANTLFEHTVCEHRDATTLIARVTLTDEMPEFDGHFPTQPILPGVVQLNLVQSLAEDWLGRRLRLSAVPQMKFTVPLRPGDTVSITLTYTESPKGHSVTFVYDVARDDNRLHASRGKVIFVER